MSATSSKTKSQGRVTAAEKRAAAAEHRATGDTPRSNAEVAGQILGCVILGFGLFLLASSIFYFFSWREDAALLSGLGSDNPNFEFLKYQNPCGPAGARFGDLLIGKSFGLFGLMIPLMTILIGLRQMKRVQIKIAKILLFSSLIMVLSSLTLGFIFDARFNQFGSGWGGGFGIAMTRDLEGVIGYAGCVILLLCSWVMLGVLINRDFIDTLHMMAESLLERVQDLVSSIKSRMQINTITEQERLAVERSNEPVVSENDIEIEVPSLAPFVGGGDDEYEDDKHAPFTIENFQSSEPEQVEEEPDLSEFIDDEDDIVLVSTSPNGESAPQQTLNPLTQFVKANLDRNLEIVSSEDLIEHKSAKSPYAESIHSDGILPVEQTPEPVVEPIAEPKSVAVEESVEEPVEEPKVEVKEVEVQEVQKPKDEEVKIEEQPQEVTQSGLTITVETHETELVKEAEISTRLYDPMDDLKRYRKPPVSLLVEYQNDVQELDEDEILEYKNQIEETLQNFNIPIQQIKATVGPTITLYEIVQAPGVKISKIQGLENDIAQSLKALGIRIIAPIPGRGTIGIEVPNKHKRIVSMRSSVCSKKFQTLEAELPVVVGNTIQNECYVFDLAKMPHLLVAGATGQGKSVGLNAIITSLLYRKHPAELKFVMIDPKMVEFSLYRGLDRHFMAKMESEEDVIITDPRKAVNTLNALCEEMEKRLKLLSEAGSRNITEYNTKFRNRRLNPQKGHFFMPYIVVVIDEFADLIMIAREVEAPVMRLAQKARAIGIHLIVATQRPDVKVITGGIKANFPARIAFRVTQMIDSRTIIDQPGANQLIGRGDMLFSKDGELTRIQCALVETDEVERIVEHISKQQGYSEPYHLPDYAPESSGADSASLGSESGVAIKYDSLFAEVARMAVGAGSLSTSGVQRQFEVGFNRAGRIMLQLEKSGIVGRQDGVKPREVLFHDTTSLEAKLQELGLS